MFHPDGTAIFATLPAADERNSASELAAIRLAGGRTATVEIASLVGGRFTERQAALRRNVGRGGDH